MSEASTPTPQNNINQTHAVFQQIAFYGPLPPPEILGRYDELKEGLIDHIINNSQVEAEHRRKLERDTLDANIANSQGHLKERRRGQDYALIISILSLLIAATLALFGKQIAGSILGTVGIGSIVSAFIYGRTKLDK